MFFSCFYQGIFTVINPNGTVTTKPDFSLGMGDVRDTYTQGGGSLGYTSPSFDTLDEFTQQYVDDRMSGDSLAAYNYLSGKGGAKSDEDKEAKRQKQIAWAKHNPNKLSNANRALKGK